MQFKVKTEIGFENKITEIEILSDSGEHILTLNQHDWEKLVDTLSFKNGYISFRKRGEYSPHEILAFSNTDQKFEVVED